MGAKIVKLGTMYFDGVPADPGASFSKKELSIGDTIRSWELPWVKDGGRLIADRCICVNVSWHQLDRWNFVYGKPITIDGKLYICRCLKVGNDRNGPNEWCKLMDKFGSDNALWHWEHIYFWGQETVRKDGSTELECAARGFRSACGWNSFDSRVQLDLIGFRPVLEPLSSELPDAFVSKPIRVYGQRGGYVSGTLTSFDDYDLILKPDVPVVNSCGWSVQRGDESIVQRSAIIGVYKTEN